MLLDPKDRVALLVLALLIFALVALLATPWPADPTSTMTAGG